MGTRRSPLTLPHELTGSHTAHQHDQVAFLSASLHAQRTLSSADSRSWLYFDPKRNCACRFVLLVNKQGQTRLAKYTDASMGVEERRALEGEIVRKCLARSEKQVWLQPFISSRALCCLVRLALPIMLCGLHAHRPPGSKVSLLPQNGGLLASNGFAGCFSSNRTGLLCLV